MRGCFSFDRGHNFRLQLSVPPGGRIRSAPSCACVMLDQVVGLKGLLHTGVVLSGKTKLHGVRLAQGSEIKLELRAATSASHAAVGHASQLNT